jgi:hypothetical protein
MQLCTVIAHVHPANIDFNFVLTSDLCNKFKVAGGCKEGGLLDSDSLPGILWEQLWQGLIRKYQDLGNV